MYEYLIKVTDPSPALIHIVPPGGHRILPYGFKDFKDRYVNDTRTLFIPLEDMNVSIVESGRVKKTKGSLSIPLQPSSTLEFAALVQGGWLPVAMAQVQVLMPDLNIAGNTRSSGQRACPYIGLGLGAKMFSPLLSALEGPYQRFPTLQEFASHANNLAAKVDRRYPGRVVALPTKQLLEAYLMIAKRKEQWPHLYEFFREIWNDLKRGQSASALEVSFKRITLAREKHLKGVSVLPYLLSLNCLYVNQNTKAKACPGSAILKPNTPFTPEHIYNVCSDIWLLEQAIAAMQTVGPHFTAVCTNDRGLIGAWALLKPRLSENIFDNSSATILLDFPPELAERMSPALREQVRKSLT